MKRIPFVFCSSYFPWFKTMIPFVINPPIEKPTNNIGQSYPT